MQIYSQILPKAAGNLIPKLSTLPGIKDFYLSGGTALALQLGHRESEDLDFFNLKDFNPEDLAQELLKVGTLQDTEISKGTLNTFINSVKLQFLHYPYPILEKSIIWNGIELSSVIDIACTKLVTISMRGSKQSLRSKDLKKDFIDLYVILKKYSLEELFIKLRKKYQNTNYSTTHILKSLVYFDDADAQPMPKMHIPLDWMEVKKKITSQLKDFRI